MIRFSKALSIGLLAVLVVGCSNKITSDVTRFHKLAQPSGETVRIEHRDPEKQASLEFQEYAALIGQRLGALGYRPTPADSAPDLVVRVDYEVGEGIVRSRRLDGGYPFYGHYGQFGRYGFGHYGHFGYPYGAGYGQSYSYTVYPRKLEIDIVRRSTDDIVFEGVVDSVGRNKHLNEIMIYLVQAMFEGFPGEHGVTRTVTIEIPETHAGNY